MAAAAAAGPEAGGGSPSPATGRLRAPAPGEREEAILRAIDELPGPGAALNRGDLQNALDNTYREELAQGRG